MGALRALRCRTWVGVLTAGVALAVPATAEATTVAYSGHLIDSVHRGTVSFQLKTTTSSAPKVLHFTWNDVPIKCDQGSFHLTRASFRAPMRVHGDRSFKGSSSPNGGAFNVYVVGHFNPAYTKAQGNFEAVGDYSSQATGCDTGELHWTAKTH